MMENNKKKPLLERRRRLDPVGLIWAGLALSRLKWALFWAISQTGWRRLKVFSDQWSTQINGTFLFFVFLLFHFHFSFFSLPFYVLVLYFLLFSFSYYFCIFSSPFSKKKHKYFTQTTITSAKTNFKLKNTKTVLNKVILKMKWPTPQLDQILKPIRLLFHTKLYR